MPHGQLEPRGLEKHENGRESSDARSACQSSVREEERVTREKRDIANDAPHRQDHDDRVRRIGPRRRVSNRASSLEEERDEGKDDGYEVDRVESSLVGRKPHDRVKSPGGRTGEAE